MVSVVQIKSLLLLTVFLVVLCLILKTDYKN